MAKYRYKLAGGSRIQSRNSGHLFWPRGRLDKAGFAVREPGLRGAFFIEEFQGLSSGRQSFEEGRSRLLGAVFRRGEIRC